MKKILFLLSLLLVAPSHAYLSPIGGGSGSGAVDSVNGLTGVVVLDTDDIAEATAQYFTESRAKSACVSDTAYDATSWNSVVDVAASKNAVRDQIEVMLTSISGKASSSHSHAATDITGGSLAQARGGLGADISAVSGVLVNTAGTISGVTAASANTASAIVQRDSSKNFLSNNIGLATASTTTSGGTTTLTAASARRQRFGGASAQNVVLPDATTLGQTGFSFLIDNRSANTITIKDAGSNTLYTVPTLSEALVTANSIASANGTWEIQTAIGQPATDSAAGYLSAADHASYTATGTTVSAATHANTASAIVKRTADGNVWVTGAQQKATSTATAAGTTTLTVADSPIQIWTGATTQTIKMPAANTLVQIGATYRFINKSSGTLTIQDNSAGAITTVPTNTSADIVVTNIGSAAGTWIADAAAAGGGSSLTATYVGYGDGSNALTGEASLTWDATNDILRIDRPAASTGANMLHFTHNTQTGTTTTDGVYMGYPTANSSNFVIKSNESAWFNIDYGNTTTYGLTSSTLVVQGPGTNYGALQFDTNETNAFNKRFYAGSGFGQGTQALTASSTTLAATDASVKLMATTSNNVTAVLHGATGNGKRRATMYFTKTTADNNNAIIDGETTETIDGYLTRTMSSKGDGMLIQSDNANWVTLLDSRAPAMLSKTANYTILDENRDQTIECDATAGNVTFTGYPSAGHKGWKVTIIKIDSSGNTCTYDPNASETVSGSATSVISTQWAGKTYQANGTNHLIVGSF